MPGQGRDSMKAVNARPEMANSAESHTLSRVCPPGDVRLNDSKVVSHFEDAGQDARRTLCRGLTGFVSKQER